MSIRYNLNWFVIIIGSLLSPNVTAINLQTIDAERVEIGKYIGQGKWTLVMVWATDCIPCEKQKPMIQAFHNAHVDSNAQVVGIATDGFDNRSDYRRLILHHKPNYPNFIANALSFHDDFENWTEESFRVTPTYILFKPDGKMMGVSVGPLTRAALEKIVN